MFKSISTGGCYRSATHLIVGVVKVHCLTERHFSLGLQVVQLDRPGEL